MWNLTAKTVLKRALVNQGSVLASQKQATMSLLQLNNQLWMSQLNTRQFTTSTHSSKTEVTSPPGSVNGKEGNSRENAQERAQAGWSGDHGPSTTGSVNYKTQKSAGDQ